MDSPLLIEVAPKPNHDPFCDDAPLPIIASSKESIRSFWICVAGLAIIAHTSVYLIQLLLGSVDHGLMRSALRVAFLDSLVPCLVLATVVPILYWRGGVAQRFVVALAIVIATMNSSVYSWQRTDGSNPGLCLLAISGCWGLFPMLFMFTPIRTERLRLIVASCMLVLTVCVSFIVMADLRKSHEFLYWQTFFGSAFVYAILRRNWGKVAMLESSTREDGIERTSSGTLLELMAVCALASASYMYFSQSSYEQSVLNYLQPALLGMVSLIVSMSCYKRFRTWNPKHIPWLLLVLSLMSMLIGANTLLKMVHGRYDFVRWMIFLNSPRAYFAMAFSGLSSLVLLVYLWSVLFWLRICGWRMADPGRQ